jgi:hypothetical protein
MTIHNHPQRMTRHPPVLIETGGQLRIIFEHGTDPHHNHINPIAEPMHLSTSGGTGDPTTIATGSRNPTVERHGIFGRD